MNSEQPEIAAAVNRLVEALRHELHQYGEMLALLEQQQEAVMKRAGDEVMHSAISITTHMTQVQTARAERSVRQAELARTLGQADDAAFAALVPLLPEKYRLPVDSLVRENNQLLTRIQSRARQNHLLLSRSLQLMQQFMAALLPQSAPTTYTGGGGLRPAGQPTQMIYEAVG